MIDTIVLLLPQDSFEITDPTKFTPVANWINNHRVHGIQSKQNPTKKELHSVIYKPRLTLFRSITKAGSSEIKLKIELSLPKLFFGNNFDELQLKDFAALLKKLVSVLIDMGVEISSHELAQAPASSIHYSKNIPLTDGSTPYHFINKIKEANIQSSLDVNQTDYRNDGHSFKWHCNSYEVVFYDKIKDLEKAKISSKRSLEKDSELQLDIFHKFPQKALRQAADSAIVKPRATTAGQDEKLEILRMEVRLNKRQKIKQLFKMLQIKSDLTFKSLFMPAISKKILLHYLDELENKRPPLLNYHSTNDKALLAALLFSNSNLKPKQLFYIFGLKKILEIMNLRELRAILVKYKMSDRTWYALMKDMNKIELPMASSSLGKIRKEIEKFKVLRINSLK